MDRRRSLVLSLRRRGRGAGTQDGGRRTQDDGSQDVPH
jgi:hypothetical protein